jgi:hypothetical protein
LRSFGLITILIALGCGMTTRVHVAIERRDHCARGDARVVKGPYLLAPRPDGVTVAWETSEPAPSSLIVDGARFDGGAGAHHAVVLHDLAPSSAHSYRVETGARATAPAELRTAPRAGERVRFVVYGDNRTDGDAHRRIVEAIAGESPDFLLDTGDLVAYGRDQEWQTFFDIEAPLLRTTPIFPALGNHDDLLARDRFAALFPLGPADRFGGRVYGADYGDVHVAVLDSSGSLEEQARWLDEDLAGATARGARHLFVMLHWGPFSGRRALRHGSNAAAQRYVVPVARAHRVDAIFSGHDHLYERGASGELAYFVSGGGGAPLSRASGAIAETARTASVHHYLVVDVAGDSVEVAAKDAAGLTFDRVILARR